MTDKATPRPWRVGDDPGETSCMVLDPQGRSVADCLRPKIPVRECWPNARLIVRAVNAHDDLVAALETCEGVLQDYAAGGQAFFSQFSNPVGTAESHLAALEAIRTALAKVREA